MRRLHLKLFYLRSRIKREPQGVTAKLLGVRPATMSHLEQGRSLPTLPMLIALCKHYDVTPSYLLDDDRPIEPRVRDRWSERNSFVARGDWVEVAEAALLRTADGGALFPVQSGSRFYNGGAQQQRAQCADGEAVKKLEVSLNQAGRKADLELEQQLTRELLGQRKPRRKGRGSISLMAD
jgi:transcriptional regulator with XRE-family HTH domain